MADDVVLEIKGLEKLLKLVKKKPPTFKIGVLGAGARHPKAGQHGTTTNAVVGAVHEFGAPARGIPQRSFLRIPLIEGLQKEIESAGLFDKKSGDEVVKQGTLLPWLQKLAICAEAVVDDAFENQGPGWAPWASPTYSNEGNLILTDSGQLRQSITTEVKEG